MYEDLTLTSICVGGPGGYPVHTISTNEPIKIKYADYYAMLLLNLKLKENYLRESAKISDMGIKHMITFMATLSC